MKILILRSTPNQVNLNTYNVQEIGLAKALIRKGHKCDVACYTKEKKDQMEILQFDGNKSLKVIWLHGYGIFYEGIYPSLKAYVDDYDIIQIGGYIGITSCWLNRHVQDKVINYQGPYYCPCNKGDILKAKIWDHILLPLSHKKRMIVGSKSKLATEYVKSKGIEDVTTIGVGIDLENLMPLSDVDTDTYDFFEGKSGEKYLLYIGVLEERRNILFLLEVFAYVCERMPSCRLVMIGKGNVKYTKRCFQKIEALNLQDKVIYREKMEQKNLRLIYEKCDVFLLPTRYEIFGMVLLEAMYFGLPVITTYNGGSSTLINDGENGYIIDELKTEKWGDRVLALLKDQETAQSVGSIAKRTIENSYTWDMLADKFIEIYTRRLREE